MGVSIIPTGDFAAVINDLKTEVEGFDSDITAIKTETDKIPATITKVDGIKVDTDKMDATITKVDTVKDALALSVLESTPAEDATDVAVSSTITIVFDRYVREAAGNTDLLAKISVSDPTPTSYTLLSAEITDDTLVITIDGDLANAVLVTAVLDKDGIVAQNNSGKMEDDFTLTFTTVA